MQFNNSEAPVMTINNLQGIKSYGLTENEVSIIIAIFH